MNTIKRIFLVLFVLSTLGALTLFAFSPRFPASTSATQEPGVVVDPATGEPETAEPSKQNSMGYMALIGSALTSLTSLVGFITTTAITWRKEKREASLAEMERRKLETELEKSRLELEEMKKSRKKKK